MSKVTDYLDPFFNLSDEETAALYDSLSKLQQKQVKDEAEYYLLCYPQGTGNAVLEDTLDKLTAYWWPDEE